MPAITLRALRHAANLITGAYRRNIGALALIRDDEGRILLARPTYPPRIWNLPGGRIERQEAPDEGLAREVAEETGLQVRVGRLLLVDAGRPGALTFTFACTVVAGSLAPASGEIAAVRWIDERDIDRLAPRVARTLRDALAAGDATRYVR